MPTAAMAQPPASPVQYPVSAPTAQPISSAMPGSPAIPAFMGGCDLPLAMAWFEDQKYGTTYNPEDALRRGTLFPDLDKPWLAPQRRSMQ